MSVNERTDTEYEGTGRVTGLERRAEQRLSVAEAAEVLEMNERHVWRILAAYREKGSAAVAHRNRGRQPANAIREGITQRLMAVLRGRCLDVNHDHLTGLLAERQGMVLYRSTMPRLVMGAGLPIYDHRRPPGHRCRRQGMPQEGMLLQIDGSQHLWLETGAHGSSARNGRRVGG
ncbi:MAG: helix-turn-helix domain-containing protein [Dehalococcoidia bacterium]|nr:helix-turn-helix domain-containing protein [Dehalococcoidia bacterium]